MTQFLTTRELAAMLRVKERKVYELAAEGALPVRRVTGKLLFPRAEIEEWIVANGGLTKPGRSAGSAPVLPHVIAGGHDPLLEWALRESRSGIAAFLDGALDGLAARGERRLHRCWIAHPRAWKRCLECRGGQRSRSVTNPSC